MSYQEEDKLGSDLKQKIKKRGLLLQLNLRFRFAGRQTALVVWSEPSGPLLSPIRPIRPLLKFVRVCWPLGVLRLSSFRVVWPLARVICPWLIVW